MYWIKCTVSNVLCQMYCVKYTVSNVLVQMYWIKCTVSNVLCQMYCVNCTGSNVLCQMYGVKLIVSSKLILFFTRFKSIFIKETTLKAFPTLTLIFNQVSLLELLSGQAATTSICSLLNRNKINQWQELLYEQQRNDNHYLTLLVDSSRCGQCNRQHINR